MLLGNGRGDGVEGSFSLGVVETVTSGARPAGILRTKSSSTTRSSEWPPGVLSRPSMFLPSGAFLAGTIGPLLVASHLLLLSRQFRSPALQGAHSRQLSIMQPTPTMSPTA